MIDLFVILLIAFIILLLIQIIALIRVKQLINRLRRTLIDLGNMQRNKSFILPKQLRICQFRKYSMTFIKANITGNKESFYYRCAYRDKNVSLTSTCKHFEFDDRH